MSTLSFMSKYELSLSTAFKLTHEYEYNPKLNSTHECPALLSTDDYPVIDFKN